MGRSEVTRSSLPPLLFSSDLCWYESVSLRLGLVHWHQWSHGSFYSWWIWSNGNVYSKKNSNVQEVLDKYSRYSNEKHQPWASSTNVTCLHHVLRISVESAQVLERFGFGNRHPSGWCFSASQRNLLDLPVCWTAQLWDRCLLVSAGLDMRHVSTWHSTELATTHWAVPAVSAAKCRGKKERPSPRTPREWGTESRTGLRCCVPFIVQSCTFSTAGQGQSFHSRIIEEEELVPSSRVLCGTE